MPKNTAHRPSQSNMKYVRNAAGHKVLNTAYVARTRSKVSATPVVGVETRDKVYRDFQIGRSAERVSKTLSDSGYSPMLVGGFVRDTFLGRESKDVDIEVFDAESIDEVARVLKPTCRVDEVGKQFGVLKVTLDGETIDVSVPRRESNTGAGHRDLEVTADAGLSFEEAATRRDFTINALMADPATGEVVDNFGGLKDLNDRKLSMVSEDKFSEDPLRVFRAARFSSQLGFEADKNLKRVMSEADVSGLPMERVWGELEKIVSSEQPGKGICLMDDTGLSDKCGFKKIRNPVKASPEAYSSEMGLSATTHRVPKSVISDGRKAAIVAAAAENGTRADVLDAMVESGGRADIADDILRLRGATYSLPRNLKPEPPILNGHDVMNRGFSGSEIKDVLVKHRKAINRGLISNRKEAEEWLSRQKHEDMP